MNWPRPILDGLAMALLFNAVVGVGFLLYPQAYTTMFPKEIKKAAAPFVDQKEVRKMKLLLYSLYLLLFVYWAVSAHFAGISGFWTLFWTGYVEMTVVSVSDFLILDCWLPPKAKPYKGGGGLQGVESEGMAFEAGDPGARARLDVPRLPRRGTGRGRIRELARIRRRRHDRHKKLRFPGIPGHRL